MLTYVKEITDPNSPKYGQYLTLKQVSELTSPYYEDIEAVDAWLLSNGNHDSHLIHPEGIVETNRTMNSGWISFDITVDRASELLNAEYFVYYHQET